MKPFSKAATAAIVSALNAELSEVIQEYNSVEGRVAEYFNLPFEKRVGNTLQSLLHERTGRSSAALAVRCVANRLMGWELYDAMGRRWDAECQHYNHETNTLTFGRG